jgi:predicted metal-dependent hydrolase
MNHMDATPAGYDPRYLAGIVLFNRHDFFEAHEVWEDLWMDTPAPEKRFYQGLIQAAVGLCHFANGNLRGAAKLYGTGRAYMERFGSPFLGLDTARFWQEMERCFAPVLAAPEPDRHAIALDVDLVPTIGLDPPPETWPDPAAFLEAEEG